MKQIIALMLTVILCISLVGCGNKSELSGTYQAEFDIYDSVVTQFDTILNVADSEYSLKNYLDEFTLTLVFAFNDDGTYSVRAQADATEETLRSVKDAILPLMNDMLFSIFKDRFAPKGFTIETQKDIESIVGMTWDEVFINTLGKSPEQFVSDLIDTSFADVLNMNLYAEGTYKAKDGKLYLSNSLESDPPKDSYRTYELGSGTVTVTEAVNIETDLIPYYPFTLTQINTEESK